MADPGNIGLSASSFSTPTTARKVENCSLSECSQPSTVSKNTIKMIGHHSRLRDVTGQS